MKTEKLDPALADTINGFGDRLQAARLALGFVKQVEFARQLGVSEYRYNHWEKGRHPPGPHYLALMKQKYGIGADWILSGDYGALSGRLMQAIVSLGAASTAPQSARELRRALPDIPDPTPHTDRRTLHEPQAGPPGRYIRATVD